MPNYDYACKQCGKVKEIFHQMTADPEILCECGLPMKRQLGVGGGILFKGSGWAGKDIKRENEDQKLGKLVKAARKLKTSGKVPMDEKLGGPIVRQLSDEY